MKQPGSEAVLSAVDRLGRWEGADRLIDAVRKAVEAVPLGPGVRDVLHGRQIGHPLHPVLVQVPVGTWLSAGVLDLLPGVRGAQSVLIGVGLVTAFPSAVAGWADWAQLSPEQQRVGVVHAASNGVAVMLFAGSLAARLRGRHGLGKLLGFAGLTATGAGGALGGHLAYRQAAGANHADYVRQVVPPGWHRLADLTELPIGEPIRRHLDDVPVLVVREDERTVHVLADRCGHLAGPLSEGELTDGCVRCPWHGSEFRLSDGWNVRGPATAPQPCFAVRIVSGRVEVRLEG
ncbi:Rieske (2Fe-2S) protein [Streptomyces sp. J2-1]|uniref:Rieske (2Fe-2S) protein n=1 Tax=Streptomyces corallincola TaxID=2851888 RepID=UPI001C386B6A|nr:Rieske (2Fe-2S) protein [Streptomyces corallincola]MBV2355563.1 Rieske (2Fe-2S) protein [Streptomyces corallincola]